MVWLREMFEGDLAPCSGVPSSDGVKAEQRLVDQHTACTHKPGARQAANTLDQGTWVPLAYQLTA